MKEHEIGVVFLAPTIVEKMKKKKTVVEKLLFFEDELFLAGDEREFVVVFEDVVLQHLLLVVVPFLRSGRVRKEGILVSIDSSRKKTKNKRTKEKQEKQKKMEKVDLQMTSGDFFREKTPSFSLFLKFVFSNILLLVNL